MKYAFEGRVRFSETDENGLLTNAALVNYFQDVATFHSEDAGVGLRALLDTRHAVWVLSSWQILIDERPHMGEQICASTWAYQFKGCIGLRNFTLTGEGGRLLARANSVWSFFDLDKLRPVRVDEEMKSHYAMDEPLDMPYQSRKMQIPEGGDIADRVVIGRSHLDANHHVNNGQYIVIAEAYAGEAKQCRKLSAEYKMQAHLGDVILPRVITLPGETIVALENEEGKLYCAVSFA